MQIFNKKAGFDYELTGERLESGISLLGLEAKALREGRADISNSHVRILNNEAFIINANIPVPEAKNYNSTRIRKLLLHRSQIISLLTSIKTHKLAIVPVKLYNKGRLIKLELALAKPKRKFEKKESIKKHDIERDIAKELRGEKK